MHLLVFYKDIYQNALLKHQDYMFMFNRVQGQSAFFKSNKFNEN
jgi:hypothetical protein